MLRRRNRRYQKLGRMRQNIAAAAVIALLLFAVALAKAAPSPVDRCCPTPYESGDSFCRNAFCRICTCDVKAVDALKLLRWSVGHDRAECGLSKNGG